MGRDRRAGSARCLFAVLAAILAALWLGVLPFGDSAAQELDGPVRLVPSEPPAVAAPGGSEDAARAGEAAGEPATEPLIAGERPAVAEPEIKIGTLEALGPDSVGLVPAGMRPLPPDFWSAMTRQAALALLRRLPLEVPSPALHALMLRLLLSPGTAPTGPGERGGFVRLRAELLGRMGAYASADALLGRANIDPKDPMRARLESEGWLARLDSGAACQKATAALSWSDDPYWQEVLIFCQAQRGQLEAATLGIDLMREAGVAPDPALAAIVGAIVAATAGLEPPEPGAPVLASLPNATPLVVAALDHAGFGAPADVVDGTNGTLLAVIARAAATPDAVRVAAAERADAQGALPVEALRAAYAAVSFDDETAANPLPAVERIDPPLARALLYQTVAREVVPTARAEVLASAIDLADEQGMLGPMARALAAAVRGIPVRPEFSWFAEPAARALIVAGDVAAADAWIDKAVERAAHDAESAAAVRALWPLMTIAGAPGPLDAARFADWWAAEIGAGATSTAIARAARTVRLLDALGHGVPPEAWHALLIGPLVEPTRGVVPALSQALRRAAEGGRVGETALLTLLAIGPGGVSGASTETLALAVASLRAVGLADAARALALEAALAGGL